MFSQLISKLTLGKVFQAAPTATLLNFYESFGEKMHSPRHVN